jgi:hypothetical protein
MNTSRENIIAALTEDLAPVKRFATRDGLLLIVGATALALAASVAIHGFWFGMFEGQASGFFWITNGLLLMLGGASGLAVVTSASPRVGPRPNSPGWSTAMLAIIPAAALITFFAGGHEHDGALVDGATALCTRSSLFAALAIAAASVWWLRKGAPVSPERSGWLVGIASGALGTFAYGITCPVDSLTHMGLWHVVPVAIAAVIGRLAVPPLIRW